MGGVRQSAAGLKTELTHFFLAKKKDWTQDFFFLNELLLIFFMRAKNFSKETLTGGTGNQKAAGLV